MMTGQNACVADGVILLTGEAAASSTFTPPPAPDEAAAVRAAWMREGPAGLATLDGVFACAIRDAGRLWVYRNSSGLRQLFVHRTPGGPWQAAGTLATAAIAPAARATIDRNAVHEYLRLLDIAAPRTVLHGMQAVEPGQLLCLTLGAQVPQAVSVTPVHAAPRPANFVEAVDTLDVTLGARVAKALRGVGRAGAFLSGGVDSALVCALAVPATPAITALTVGFDGAGFDEAPVAARIAAHLGIAHEVLRFGRAETLRAFNLLARGMDQPMADPATMATVLAFEHCRDRFDVVLDGTGADEAVGAMPPRHVRLAVGVGSLVPAPLRRLLVRAMTHIPGLAGYTPILDFEHPAETLMRWKGFTRSEIEELCGEPVSLAQTTFYRTFARFPRRAHYERYSALLNAMPSDRLTQAMKLTGLNVRFPFFARDVDAFLRQLPTEWRYLPGQPKRILRELLARYVPRELWDAPKHGFDFPLHDFLAGEGFELVQRHVLNGRWLDRGLLRPDVVRRYAQQYIGGDRRLMFRVWALVVLGAWLDAHEDLMIAPPCA